MNRAHALALTLVNWKGVFFERYLLDRHVTALEGANGAGKTTVMIAAYVVLLPDLQRLKFTNLGETGATGGDRGIWGRLGEAGPSYAALEIELEAGERVLCGVHLERKAAPSLSLTPFLISRIPAHVSSERFLLSDTDAHEEVCPLSDLAGRVSAAGSSLELFGSAKDYFARLFELGITALRLGTDEERNKLNDMLRTSMTGGISRTLTSDLRSFLFKRESGLLDTLTRMRQNLDACRRTRLEVSEARVLEREISGIYSAGQAMFGAAVGASRAQSSEGERRLAHAEQALAQAEQRALELETRLEEVQLRNASLRPRWARAQAAETSAREQLTRLERAAAAAERLRGAQAALERTAAPLAETLERKARAAALRESNKLLRNEAQATLVRASAGLASLQAGLEELHRQSHAFGRVRDQLALARRLLGECLEPSLDADGHLAAALAALAETAAGAEAEAGAATAAAGAATAAAAAPGAAAAGTVLPAAVAVALGRVQEARRALDRERAAGHRQATTAAQRQSDYSAARAALAALSGVPATDEPGVHARRELARLNELDVLATRVPELEREWHALRALAQRQQALGAELRALGFEPLPGARDFAAALAALERGARESEQQQRQHELQAERATERAAALQAQLPALEARAERYRRLAQLAQRQAGRGQPAPLTRAELGEQMRALEAARRTMQDRARLAEQRREQALALALAQEPSGEGPQQGLLRLAERLDGQLLVARHEELEIEDARRTQAELGPLSSAIVVDDPERALAVLCEQPHGEESVWLVRAGAWPLSGPGARTASGHVVVDLGYGLRVTRLPERVQLGRAARERRARELRAEAESLSGERELAQRELRELDAARSDLEQLWEHWDVWASGDPVPEIARTTAELASARAELAEAQRLGRAARLEAARRFGQYDTARPHLGEHALLDPPDHGAAEEGARLALERARGAAAELARLREPRATLLAQLHILDAPAPDGSEPCLWQRRAPLLDAQSDRLFAVAEALSLLERERAAWAWSDAPRALAEHTRLVPELEAQHERAQQEAARVQAELERAEADWEAATAGAQSVLAEHAAGEAHVARARAELESEGVSEPSLGLEPQRLELARLSAALEQLRAEERGIDAEVALCRERLHEARQAQQRSQTELDHERARAEPAAHGARTLIEAAGEAGLLEEVEAVAPEAADASSAQLWLEAEGKRALLADRLLAARGGAELARSVGDARAGGADDEAHVAFGERVFALWLAVRGWLAKRLPAPIAELTPQQGLLRLEADLEQLERRLERQEGDLRGTSGDVARSIEVQVRRAVAQVRRLNVSLEGVSFGSIHGIRVQLERVTKMEQVLRALRDGETQELLFQSNLPIEAALDEIFRRHAGGRNGGERLIDYREYLELWVCIQRRPDADWERVNPSQVSTGEAIGVGAALMMVILAEWEREDQLLRRQRSLGSLRFLFLDEANRLSQDNLGVLFDLCRTLDLQLLIAAPEVARAEGNTTYRLVRRVNDAGREEVLVTGRRASLPSPVPIEAPAVVAPAAPVQTALFTN